MNNDEYNKLFHKLELNLVAFKPLMQCEQEVLKLVNAAITAEREACAKLVDEEMADYRYGTPPNIALNNAAAAIRARGQHGD